MKIILKFLLLMFLTLSCCGSCFAQKTVVVIPDKPEKQSSQAFLYTNTSELMAKDVVNALNFRANLNAANIYDAKNLSKANMKSLTAKNMLSDYKNKYLVDMDAINKLNNSLKADYILLISTELDIQSYIMKGTVWNWLNVPGVDAVNPQYNLVTLVTLIDTSKELVIWQNVYEKLIDAYNFNMLAPSPSPNPVQLNKIKKYTTKLAPKMAVCVEQSIKDPTQEIKDVKGIIIIRRDKTPSVEKEQTLKIENL